MTSWFEWGIYHQVRKVPCSKVQVVKGFQKLTLPEKMHAKASTMLLAVDLGRWRIHLPISAWKDSSFVSSDMLRIQDSAPYRRVRSTQLTMMLLEDRGFSVPWKTPLPLEKKAPLAFFFDPLWTREGGGPPCTKAPGWLRDGNCNIVYQVLLAETTASHCAYRNDHVCLLLMHSHNCWYKLIRLKLSWILQILVTGARQVTKYGNQYSKRNY